MKEVIKSELEPSTPEAIGKASTYTVKHGTNLDQTGALNEQLKELIKKLEPARKKDLWDKLSVFTTLIGTVILAGISLFVTQSFQREEANRAHEYQEHESERAAKFNDAQVEIQKAQIRVEELKAVTALAPLLTSSDPSSRETGRQLLQAVQTSGNPPSSGQIQNSPDETGPAQRKLSVSLLDKFAEVALSASVSPQDRVVATRKIGEIATAPTASFADRQRATQIVSKLVTSDQTPAEVRDAASNVLDLIKRVSIDDAVKMISSEPVTRQITELILHCTFSPAKMYDPNTTVRNVAKAVIERFNNGEISWHFAIAPDGSVWLGAPLSHAVPNVRGHNANSVSIYLFLDGDHELPTDAQRNALVKVMRAVSTRLNLDLNSSADGKGLHFHRDYQPTMKTCPGALFTKELVLGWLGP